MVLPLLALTAAAAPPSGCCGMAAFATDPAFMAAHTLRTDRVSLKGGKDVTLPLQDGKVARAYFVVGDDEPKAALILFHEWWGLNDYIKKDAEELYAATGYAVLAVDLYRGKAATTREEAGALMQGLDQAYGDSVVNAAIRGLRKGSLAGVDRIGTVGYCMGGTWALRAAVLGGDQIQAAVGYYGMPPTGADVAKIQAPVLFILATRDKWITPEVAATFQGEMEAQGKAFRIAEFDADHAFSNPSSPNFDSDAALRARAVTVEFFRQHLGG